MTYDHQVQGTVAAGFEQVRAEFAAVAADQGGDYAAQLVAYAGSEQVVDLWVGPEMAGDTLTGVFSVTKGATALVVALLLQDGVLDLDQRVAHYWPEFAAAGKQDITLRTLFSHQAGLVGVEGGLRVEEVADDRVIAARLAAQAPYWRPGAAHGYHALVIGALANEVVRRATGRSVQEIYEERVRVPFDLDFHLGLPAELEPRFRTSQPLLPTPEQQAALRAGATGVHSLTGIAFNRNHPQAPALDELPNLPLVRRLSPASVGGVGSARGIAAMYAAAVSGLNGAAPLLKPETLALVGQIQTAGKDQVTLGANAFGVIFQAAADRYPALGQGAIGHSGAAGAMALADPRSGLAYGYVRRRFTFPGGAAPENDRLVPAVHGAVVAAL
ncbi:serine hydrolase domain-containing protein [Kitasatospora sp. NPDC058965]|uniref:serine hydrolase domain-containing protein n=1 Tax=Kitasatospora sp. NPDC058965 TaxID=3346682 RepID=UPI00367B87C5